MAFKNWLECLVDEKGIDRNHVIEVMGNSGMNYIPIQNLMEMMFQVPKHEQDGIKSMIVKIDFANASVMDYFKHLAKAIAI